MPQQYPTLPDTMYSDYRQPPPSYQDNYQMMYPHSSFPHYRSAIAPSAGSDTAYDYNQPYYSTLQPSNSYGMLPSYQNSGSAFASNFHTSSYSTNFHTPPYPSYENISTSPTSTLNIPTDLESNHSDHNGSIAHNLMKNSPIESSDRSESSFSSKLEICSKSDDAMTELSESIGNTEPNPIENIYQSCGEENASSKLFVDLNFYSNLIYTF